MVSASSIIPPTIAHGEKPEKFTGTDFKRWDQKMLFYLTIGLATGRIWAGPPLPHSCPNYINPFPIPIPYPGWDGLMSPITIYKRVDNPIPVPNVFSGRGGVGCWPMPSGPSATSSNFGTTSESRRPPLTHWST